MDLQIPIHRQTLEHRQQLTVTDTNDAPPEVTLRLHALRIALDAVALVRGRSFIFDELNVTPAQRDEALSHVDAAAAHLLDHAFTQADRVMDYYQNGQWERTPEPIATMMS
jgi:hypothetical protein